MTATQRRALEALEDGKWHSPMGRAMPELVALGFAKAGKRKRQPNGLPPSFAYTVYVYRLTDAGRAALDAAREEDTQLMAHLRGE